MRGGAGAIQNSLGSGLAPVVGVEPDSFGAPGVIRTPDLLVRSESMTAMLKYGSNGRGWPRGRPKAAIDEELMPSSPLVI